MAQQRNYTGNTTTRDELHGAIRELSAEWLPRRACKVRGNDKETSENRG
jgi:hypothetical protein